MALTLLATVVLHASLPSQDLQAPAPSSSAPPPSIARPVPIAPALDSVVGAAAARGLTGTILVGRLSDAAQAPPTYARHVGTDARTGAPITLASRWRWASVTKQVTAVLVMQEVAAGRLALDVPIARVLPSFRGPTASRITVRQLLQHTSGLPDPDASASTLPPLFTTAPAGDANRAATAGACAGAPRAEPGASFNYDNCDYLVLGALLSHMTKRPYHQLVRDRLARDAGTRAIVVQRDARRTDVASPPTADGAESRLVLAAYGAAAAIVAPLTDMLAFDRALAGNRLLPRNWRDTLWAGDRAIGYAALGAWSYPATLAGCTGPMPLVERRGEIGGVQLRNVIAPTRDRAVIIAVNAPGIDFGEVWQGRGLLHDVLAAALCRDGDPQPTPRD